jgi:hypothetical protein
MSTTRIRAKQAVRKRVSHKEVAEESVSIPVQNGPSETQGTNV